MKRRPHKIVSVVLLAVLIAGMGMACRIQRWTENTETAGKILTESGKKEAQKQTNGTENDDAAQNAKRVFGDEPAELYARSAVLIDADSGRVLFGKDTDVVRPMASTTKIMTCILALESLREHPDQTIEVSDQAASQPKVHLGMQKGEVFYIKDLLYSLMLESHNDSAVAVAEGIAGSVEEFAKEMNAKAAEIGCKNTHFITPNGLDAEDEGGVHSTTAEDLAKIMRYCIMTSGEKETFLEVTRTKEYQFQDADRKRTFSCHNHNAFLDMMDGALSGKTGFTADAGYCYVGSLRWDDRTFIVALLACGWPNNKGYKWKDTRKLMEYGLEHYQYRDIDKKMQIPEIKVAGGVDDKKPYQYCLNVPVKIERPAEENSKILMRDGEELRAKLELAKYWNAPLKKGEKIDPLLKDGYSTISLGYIGLYEVTKLMTGKSHTDAGAKPFALSVMRKACDTWKEETGLGFGLYGTPAESLCYRFARIDQERFGTIEDVTDKGYYTNSYHVDVREKIDAFSKFRFESQFQTISSGGAISYVEIPNMRHNLEALEEIVRFIYDNIQYAEFNTKSDYCHVCDYDGEIMINDDNEWECPQCGNKDHSKMNVTRRTCGYLGENFWNVGKTKEIKARVLHL